MFSLARGERESRATRPLVHVLVAITAGWRVPGIPKINGSDGQEAARGAG